MINTILALGGCLFLIIIVVWIIRHEKRLESEQEIALESEQIAIDPPIGYVLYGYGPLKNFNCVNRGGDIYVYINCKWVCDQSNGDTTYLIALKKGSTIAQLNNR